MTSGTRALTLASLLLVTTLSSCAQLPKPSATSSAESATVETQANVPTQSLSGEDLFQLFLAEIATNRRDYGAAAALYSELASHYNDVALIERAVVLNQTIGNFTGVSEFASKWVDLRPEEPRAFAALALGQIATQDLTASAETLDRWLKLDPDADVSLILQALENISAEQLLSMQSVLSDLQPSHPKSASLLYTQSRIALATGDANGALDLANRSLKLADNLQVSLFKFQILNSQNNTDAAGELIRKLYKANPTNRQVAVQYARHLFRFERENLNELERLHTRFATEPAIARTYARAAFDQEEYDAAQAVYQHLLAQGFADEAHYFLGRIDLINALPDSAVNHFEAVTGENYLPSALAEWVTLARAEDQSRLLTALETGKANHPELAPTLWRLQSNYFQLLQQPEMAWQTLDDAVVRYPDDLALLYDQAMMAAGRDNYSLLENNLLAILEIDPDNTDALNALGYTWADLNKNLSKAESFIEKAIAAEPENPAFQDSKGWLLYRQGKLEESLEWLQRAFSQMKNDEVAAHIAEVLWMLDRKGEAQQFLDTVEQINPDSRYIEALNELFAQ